MPIIFIALLFLLLCFPTPCIEGAAAGLQLWLFTLVPTFFPFLYLTNQMISCGAVKKISRPCRVLFRALFGVTSSGAFVVMMGFLCGYPMGAKLAAEFVKSGRITREEGEYLLTFCNNPSPMFLTGYILKDCLRAPVSKAAILVMFYAAPVFTGILAARLPLLSRPGRSFPEPPNVPGAEKTASFFSGSGAAIADAFSVLINLGGYVILFHIISALLTDRIPALSSDSSLFGHLILANLEMTGGAARLAASGLSAELTNLFVPLCVLFGGVSILAQTKGLLEGSGLRLGPYLTGKLAQLILFSGMYLLWLTCSHAI